MNPSIFKIFNASAGSGKTYTLTQSYLKLLLKSNKPEAFKSILALTFTNKAVEEMKLRIVDTLIAFSKHTDFENTDSMFKTLCIELKLTPQQLKKKATTILKQIIHNYGSFDITTIDGFTHRVIRTFAYDIKLPVNFEVELDVERLITEAVDQLLAKAGLDKTLTKILIDFAIEKADDDKSWDISYDFNAIAKLLVNENHLPYISALSDKSFEDFQVLKNHFNSEIKALKIKIIEKSEAVLNYISECGLEYNDFNRSLLPKHFENLNNEKFSVSFETAWQNDLISLHPIYPKRVSDTVKSTIETIQPYLIDAFTETKALVFELKQNTALLKNITPLSVLHAIWQELKVLKNEQNKILISEFNTIIANEIKQQPAPFIYERLGEKYKHYFIDEFQDTSVMQWHNLIPLVDNVLSASNGSVMLVGDAKQAIYRWRGGKAEQFIDLFNGETNPFQIKAKVSELDTNYRSSKAIVEFNNKFFEFLSQYYLSNNTYSQLYKNTKQNISSKNEGYVSLDFLDFQQDNSENLYESTVLEKIQLCQENGYTYKDICVLVRKRKQGIAIANYLTDHGVKITSSETMLLKNSTKVTFINHFLKFLINPKDDSLKIEVLSFLARVNNIEDKHQFFASYIKKDFDEIFCGVAPVGVKINKKQLLQYSLYELIETIIRLFHLNATSDVYIQFYLDTVLEVSEKQNLDITGFVNHFEKHQDKLCAVIPNDMNAVKIMTIHKSKGLEFPVVIFPYAELDIYRALNPKVWFPLNQDKHHGFKTLLMNYNKDIKMFGELGEAIYNQHQSELELDNINLLYVVLTRAIEKLLVISKKDINSKGIVNEKTYSGFFISYLKANDKWVDNQSSYNYGVFEPKINTEIDVNATTIEQFISTPRTSHNLNIITKSGLLWDTKQGEAIERGNLVHYILSKIKHRLDVDFVFSDLLASGDISIEQNDTLKPIIHNIVNLDTLKPYFEDGFQVYNEHDILIEKGHFIRPDRMCVHKNKNVTLIDYKTGLPQQKHHIQLNVYEDTLKKMGYQNVEKLLIYINDNIEVMHV